MYIAYSRTNFFNQKKTTEIEQLHGDEIYILFDSLME